MAPDPLSSIQPSSETSSSSSGCCTRLHCIGREGLETCTHKTKRRNRKFPLQSDSSLPSAHLLVGLSFLQTEGEYTSWQKKRTEATTKGTKWSKKYSWGTTDLWSERSYDHHSEHPVVAFFGLQVFSRFAALTAAQLWVRRHCLLALLQGEHKGREEADHCPLVHYLIPEKDCCLMPKWRNLTEWWTFIKYLQLKGNGECKSFLGSNMSMAEKWTGWK